MVNTSFGPKCSTHFIPSTTCRVRERSYASPACAARRAAHRAAGGRSPGGDAAIAAQAAPKRSPRWHTRRHRAAAAARACHERCRCGASPLRSGWPMRTRQEAGRVQREQTRSRSRRAAM
eukprot:1195867-Prymnesium_polylepis.1